MKQQTKSLFYKISIELNFCHEKFLNLVVCFKKIYDRTRFKIQQCVVSVILFLIESASDKLAINIVILHKYYRFATVISWTQGDC